MYNSESSFFISTQPSLNNIVFFVNSLFLKTSNQCYQSEYWFGVPLFSVRLVVSPLHCFMSPRISSHKRSSIICLMYSSLDLPLYFLSFSISSISSFVCHQFQLSRRRCTQWKSFQLPTVWGMFKERPKDCNKNVSDVFITLLRPVCFLQSERLCL